jgi:hypothetical protein
MSFGVTESPKGSGVWYVTGPDGDILPDVGPFSSKEAAENEAGRMNADLEEPPKG